MRLIKRIFLWLLIMFSYWGLTYFAPVELTRYIHAWLNAYGQFPTGIVTPTQELSLIWVSYILSSLLVGILSWDFVFGHKK